VERQQLVRHVHVTPPALLQPGDGGVDLVRLDQVERHPHCAPVDLLPGLSTGSVLSRWLLAEPEPLRVLLLLQPHAPALRRPPGCPGRLR
jgi:hypothetical protein